MMQFFGKIMLKFKGAKTLKSAPVDYQCQCCGETKPLNKEHFQPVRKFKHGYSTYCNQCDIISKKIKPKNNETN